MTHAHRATKPDELMTCAIVKTMPTAEVSDMHPLALCREVKSDGLP